MADLFRDARRQLFDDELFPRRVISLPEPVDFVSPTGRDIEVFARLPMEILRRIVLMAQVFIRGIRVPRPPPLRLSSRTRLHGMKYPMVPWDPLHTLHRTCDARYPTDRLDARYPTLAGLLTAEETSDEDHLRIYREVLIGV